MQLQRRQGTIEGRQANVQLHGVSEAVKRVLSADSQWILGCST